VRRFLTRHWVWLHVAVAVTVPVFLGLGWWQVERAGAGNARSYGYAVEWPSLAAIVIFLYVRAIRMELRNEKAAMQLPQSIDVSIFTDQPGAILVDDEHDDDDPELAAYNEYLRELNERGLEKRR
jgi:DNA-binding transcriptional regulator of glucitol operon